MKYLICSDIHGSSDSAHKLIDIYNSFQCDRILCLGDVLYHGPRNDLPLNYNPKEVIKILNEYSSVIDCVKGNCEAEVDEMVLNFKIYDFLDLNINGMSVHAEHGHHLDEYKGEALVIMSGHTHIPVCEKKNGIIYINPGSTTIPKNGSQRGYAIWDNNEICLYDFTGNIVSKINY